MLFTLAEEGQAAQNFRVVIVAERLVEHIHRDIDLAHILLFHLSIRFQQRQREVAHLLLRRRSVGGDIESSRHRVITLRKLKVPLDGRNIQRRLAARENDGSRVDMLSDARQNCC